MGNGFLARSVYGGCCEGRYDYARRCGEFTQEELDHPHLNKDKPTPADAISFMELVLTKIG